MFMIFRISYRMAKWYLILLATIPSTALATPPLSIKPTPDDKDGVMIDNLNKDTNAMTVKGNRNPSFTSVIQAIPEQVEVRLDGRKDHEERKMDALKAELTLLEILDTAKLRNLIEQLRNIQERKQESDRFDIHLPKKIPFPLGPGLSVDSVDDITGVDPGFSVYPRVDFDPGVSDRHRTGVNIKDGIDPRFGVNPVIGISPRHGIVPRFGVGQEKDVRPEVRLDHRISLDPTTGLGSMIGVGPRIGSDPAVGLDSRLNVDQRIGENNKRSVNPGVVVGASSSRSANLGNGIMLSGVATPGVRFDGDTGLEFEKMGKRSQIKAPTKVQSTDMGSHRSNDAESVMNNPESKEQRVDEEFRLRDTSGKQLGKDIIHDLKRYLRVLEMMRRANN
ncbi:hypothetical protein LSH36_1002g02007 [Paralvinella palmiformis]|uniref:Uncharacterized protein n=1 Tax=Paralvinella palmiformis TaxID=53620 RepID=A0AAD9IXT0_9ANNE|nr:hypothetical protein LSH36_1002g02007 [Paralvinella palmiformis]